MMWQFLIIFGVSLVSVQAQIPSLGRCPEFEPMANFNREKFLGAWYEFERYFTATEVLSKCISAIYERRADGNLYINNHYTNRITNVKRIISGKMAPPSSKIAEGKLSVKYESFPLNYNTSLIVLDTDYDNYAVIWSCSSIGAVGHTESAWLMSRERIPRGEVLQAAYGVLDKFKLNRTFFVKTQQTECETEAPPVPVADESAVNATKNVADVAVKEVVKQDESVTISEDGKNIPLNDVKEGDEEESFFK